MIYDSCDPATLTEDRKLDERVQHWMERTLRALTPKPGHVPSALRSFPSFGG